MSTENLNLFPGKPVVEVSDLLIRYGAFTAVDNISFQIRRGEIFGLLGPNGAGKTSTLECMEGIRQRTGGSIKILDFDPKTGFRQLKNLIGVQLQSSGLQRTMTVEEAIRFFCTYHQVSCDYSLLGRFGLAEKRRVQFHALSTGMQRRLALALALVHQPEIVFLDEPTAGLDVPSRVELHKIMGELRESGTTILLATHDMAEAEKMADRVAILLQGKIVASGTPRELTAAGSKLTKIMVNTRNSCLDGSMEVFPGIKKKIRSDGYTIFFTDQTGPAVFAIIAFIEKEGDQLIDLRVERPTLEERFLELTQSPNPEGKP
jgi:ABC-2 type transport system ATP-binding protein